MATGSEVPLPSRATEIARLELARLPAELPLDQVFRRACEITANALEVERVGVWLFIDNRLVLRCANLFERSKNEHSAGTVLRVDDFPTYFDSLRIRRAIPAEVALTEPWTAELVDAYLRPLGIASMLDAGIFVDGAMVGVVCHEQVGLPREWTTEARDFAASVADVLAMRLQSAKVRELRAAFQQQRRRLEAQKQAAALEQLAAGIAHDFKNLLMIFMGHGSLLEERSDLPADVRKQAHEIVAAAERGVAMTSELLEFSRHGKRQPSVMDPASQIAELKNLLQAAVGPRYQVKCFHPGFVGQVLINKDQFTRLLLNLVMNAGEAMPRGGPIDVKLAPVELNGNPSYTGRFVLLEVSDQGGGMDETTRRRIFDPYFTTKAKGTGLGLAIVRQIVDRAGGIIRIESQLGQGTRFRVFLPRIGANTGQTTVMTVPPELKAQAAG